MPVLREMWKSPKCREVIVSESELREWVWLDCEVFRCFFIIFKSPIMIRWPSTILEKKWVGELDHGTHLRL